MASRPFLANVPGSCLAVNGAQRRRNRRRASRSEGLEEFKHPFGAEGPRIRSLLELAERKKLGGVVVPVRPSAKVKHPWVPLSEYITWTDPDGRMYDPWLRSHLASGGKIVGLAERSMVVHEPLPFWENWSKQRFETSGNYALEGTIAPVKIDVDRQKTSGWLTPPEPVCRCNSG